MRTTESPNIAELVDDTLDWVHYGEPNSTDLIELATSAFDLAAQHLGFKGNDDRIVSVTEFRRDGTEGPCLVEIASDKVDGQFVPGTLTLTVGEDEHTYQTHKEGLTALYTWCATGNLA